MSAALGELFSIVIVPPRSMCDPYHLCGLPWFVTQSMRCRLRGSVTLMFCAADVTRRSSAATEFMCPVLYLRPWMNCDPDYACRTWRCHE